YGPVIRCLLDIEVTHHVMTSKHSGLSIDNTYDAQTNCHYNDDRTNLADYIYQRIQTKQDRDSHQSGEAEATYPAWQIIVFFKDGPCSGYHHGKRKESARERQGLEKSY